MVISDWQYTPTPYWGAFVKDALSGKQFELKRMRQAPSFNGLTGTTTAAPGEESTRYARPSSYVPSV